MGLRFFVRLCLIQAEGLACWPWSRQRWDPPRRLISARGGACRLTAAVSPGGCQAQAPRPQQIVGSNHHATAG